MVQSTGNTGTLVTRPDGTLAIVGQFSGLNTQALIEATITAQRLPAVSLENQIKQDQLESESLGQLNTLLTSLQTAADKLRNAPGTSALANNSFQKKSAFLTSGTSTTASSVVGLSVDPGTQNGVYQIEVLQTAKANKLSSVAVADATTALNITDDVTIGLAGGATATISITAGQSLNDIAQSINAQSSTTKVRASVLKISDTESRLILTADETGKAVEVSGTGNFLSTLGNAGNFDVIQTADKAQIRVDGLTTVIERDTNSISDVISGVNIQLFKADPGNNITLEIQQDLGGVKSDVEAFVKAFNEFRAFYDQQRTFDPNDTSATQPALYSSTVLRSANSAVSEIFGNGPLGITSGQISSLAEVGITLNESSQLEIDATKFEDALLNNPQQLENLFAFSFESSNPDLRVLSRTSTVFPDDFEITIGGVDGSGNITSASVTGLGNVFDISGRVLTGKAGTAFEGLSLFYGGADGSGASTISVTNSVGVAEQLFNTIEEYTEPVVGQISQRVLNIDDENKSRQEQINTIDARLLVTRQFLTDKYAKLEQALAQAEASRKQLEAFVQSSNNR